MLTKVVLPPAGRAAVGGGRAPSPRAPSPASPPRPRAASGAWSRKERSQISNLILLMLPLQPHHLVLVLHPEPGQGKNAHRIKFLPLASSTR